MTTSLHVVCPRCNTTNRVSRERLAQAPSCGQCKAPLLPAAPVDLTGAAFERQVAVSEVPIVVDFWAAWCGPCKMMAPAFAAAAAQRAPNVRFGKLDTEAHGEIAARFAIRSIPTLIAFRDGREIARQSGALGLPQLLQWIDTHVAS